MAKLTGVVIVDGEVSSWKLVLSGVPQGFVRTILNCIYWSLLLRSMSTCIIDKIYTHSLNGFSNYTKQYMLAGYENSCQTETATYALMLRLACLCLPLYYVY